MIAPGVALARNVPVFDRSNDVRFVPRPEQALHFVANVGIFVFLKKVEPAARGLTTLFVAGLDGRPEAEQGGILKKQLLHPGFRNLGMRLEADDLDGGEVRSRKRGRHAKPEEREGSSGREMDRELPR